MVENCWQKEKVTHTMAIVRFKMSSLTLNFEKKKIYFSTLEATFWVNFSQYTLNFFSFLFFLFSSLEHKKLARNFSIPS